MYAEVFEINDEDLEYLYELRNALAHHQEDIGSDQGKKIYFTKECQESVKAVKSLLVGVKTFMDKKSFLTTRIFVLF